MHAAVCSALTIAKLHLKGPVNQKVGWLDVAVNLHSSQPQQLR